MAGGTSYNGWPASDDPDVIDIDPGFTRQGCAFPGGVKAGDVSTVLGYVVNQLVARVEPPLTDPGTGAPGYGCWGYSYRANVNNPSTLSCHSSGTAIDWNAPAHANGASGTFSDAQRATVYEILAECQGAVQWGGDYTGTPDEMHFEIITDAGTLAGVAALLGDVGPGPLPPLPPLEGLTMPLIVKRENGAVDWAWDDAMRVMIRIPTENYYRNLEYAGVIDTAHTTAPSCDTPFIDWFKGQVLGAGGTVYEPAQ
jgi:hypothetical protein